MGIRQEEIQIIRIPEQAFPFLVINKPQGLPSAPLSADDKENAFSSAAVLFPELLKVTGRKEIEHGLLHRLDTETSGLLMIAATQQAYDFMLQQQKEDKFFKSYRALCQFVPENVDLLKGFPENPGNFDFKLKNQKFIQSSYFRNYGEGLKEVRPVTENSGKAALKKLGKPKIYTTEISVKNEIEKITAECRISSGYRHQVRCHLAWSGIPVIGDCIYNSKEKNVSEHEKSLQFFAVGLEFENPVTGKQEHITL